MDKLKKLFKEQDFKDILESFEKLKRGENCPVAFDLKPNKIFKFLNQIKKLNINNKEVNNILDFINKININELKNKILLTNIYHVLYNIIVYYSYNE